MNTLVSSDHHSQIQMRMPESPWRNRVMNRKVNFVSKISHSFPVATKCWGKLIFFWTLFFRCLFWCPKLISSKFVWLRYFSRSQLNGSARFTFSKCFTFTWQILLFVFFLVYYHACCRMGAIWGHNINQEIFAPGRWLEFSLSVLSTENNFTTQSSKTYQRRVLVNLPNIFHTLIVHIVGLILTVGGC